MNDAAATEHSESNPPDETRPIQEQSTELVPRESTESMQYLRGRIHIATLQQELETVRDERDKLADEVKRLTADVAFLEAEIDRLEADLDRRDDQFDQIVTNYERIVANKNEQLQESGSSGLREFLGFGR